MKKKLKIEIFLLKLLSSNSKTVTELGKHLTNSLSNVGKKVYSGTIWTTLNRLTEQGLVNYVEIGDRNTVKQYSITDDGNEYLRTFEGILNNLNDVQ